MIDLVQNPNITPDLRVKRRSARVEDADNLPASTTECNRVPQREPAVGLGGIATNDQLGEARGKESPLDDLDVAANFERLGRNTTHLHIGVSARRAQRKWRNDYYFRRR